MIIQSGANYLVTDYVSLLSQTFRLSLEGLKIFKIETLKFLVLKFDTHLYVSLFSSFMRGFFSLLYKVSMID